MARDSQYQITTGHVFIGIFSTLSFCMINTVKGEHVSNSHLNVYMYIYVYKENESLITGYLQISDENSSESGQRIAKIWLLIGFVIGFASIIAAIWVMIDDFVNNGKTIAPISIYSLGFNPLYSCSTAKKDTSKGVALLLQNVFILFASLAYKFGRNEEEWN